MRQVERAGTIARRSGPAGACVSARLEKLRRERSGQSRVGLCLVLGGALGNLVDRFARGAVTDFIDFYFGSYHFHTFNLADSGITIGIVLIAWEAIFSQRSSTDRDLHPAEPPA